MPRPLLGALGGGGGKCLPESKVGNPYPKLKTPGFGPLFLGETQGHMQKQTKIKMNNIDSLKLGAASTQLSYGGIKVMLC